eukprot:TRINITY_DN468_c0_g2_i2.p1 TRINITY_DN468_c0_g2~~TRINITY_DN468_c0_g2_i2.p1  ORF type:complete len:234 (+),score=24.23 TRINITY_DN468_c0_g2_i2:196-897(+)
MDKPQDSQQSARQELPIISALEGQRFSAYCWIDGPPLTIVEPSSYIFSTETNGDLLLSCAGSSYATQDKTEIYRTMQELNNEVPRTHYYGKGLPSLFKSPRQFGKCFPYLTCTKAWVLPFNVSSMKEAKGIILRVKKSNEKDLSFHTDKRLALWVLSRSPSWRTLLPELKRRIYDTVPFDPQVRASFQCLDNVEIEPFFIVVSEYKTSRNNYGLVPLTLEILNIQMFVMASLV